MRLGLGQHGGEMIGMPLADTPELAAFGQPLGAVLTDGLQHAQAVTAPDRL